MTDNRTKDREDKMMIDTAFYVAERNSISFRRQARKGKKVGKTS